MRAHSLCVVGDDCVVSALVQEMAGNLKSQLPFASVGGTLDRVSQRVLHLELGSPPPG
jgi:hypothetical protein